MCTQLYVNYSFPTTPSTFVRNIQAKPASKPGKKKSTLALEPSNNDQVNLTSLLSCTTISPCSSYVTVAPFQPDFLIIACAKSHTKALFLLISSSSSILYHTIPSGRGRRGQPRRGRRRRSHHIHQKAYNQGVHFLLFCHIKRPTNFTLSLLTAHTIKSNTNATITRAPSTKVLKPIAPDCAHNQVQHECHADARSIY